MKPIITTTLVFLVVLFASTALAGRCYGHRDGYASRGERIERHLNARGERIERHYVHKANLAENRGEYGKTQHFQKKATG